MYRKSTVASRNRSKSTSTINTTNRLITRAQRLAQDPWPEQSQDDETNTQDYKHAAKDYEPAAQDNPPLIDTLSSSMQEGGFYSESGDHGPYAWIRSIVDDCSLQKLPYFSIWIPHKVQTRLLAVALRLVRESIWNFSRTNWPETHELRWPQSYTQIEMGRDYFDSILDESGHTGTQSTLITGLPHDLVMRRFFGVVNLRNAVAHAKRNLSNMEVEQNLCYALGLTSVLRDTSRSKRIANLRLQLRAECAKSLSEVEAGEPLAILPGGFKWQLHHKLMFEEYSPGNGSSYQDDRLPEVVGRIARNWEYPSKEKVKTFYDDYHPVKEERDPIADWYGIGWAGPIAKPVGRAPWVSRDIM